MYPITSVTAQLLTTMQLITPAAIATGTCQAPNMFVKGSVESEFMTHELRFSTDQSNALRATFGAFYSDAEA